MIRPIILLISSSFVVLADTWTSSSGKTIEADFVRLKDDSLFLITDGKEYSVPLSRLNEKSQGYARFLQGKMKGLATNSLNSAVIAESDLLDLIGFEPNLVEGKSFLMEGKIRSITRARALSSSPMTTAVVELSSGTRMELDLSGEENGKLAKVRVEEGRVTLTSRRGLKDSVNLIENGETVVFRSTVKRGKIICGGIATLQEIRMAKRALVSKPRKLTAVEKAAIERIKIRVEYVESQLGRNTGNDSGSGGKGVLGTSTAGYTEAEKESMARELGRLKAQLAELTKSASARPFRR